MKIVTDNALIYLALRYGFASLSQTVSYGKVYIYMLWYTSLMM